MGHPQSVKAEGTAFNATQLYRHAGRNRAPFPSFLGVLICAAVVFIAGMFLFGASPLISLIATFGAVGLALIIHTTTRSQ